MNTNRYFAYSMRTFLLGLALISASAWGQVKPADSNQPAVADAKLSADTMQVTVSGNQALASIDLAGVQAELSLTFEQPENLSVAALGISARLIDPLDPQLLARLPDSQMLSIPVALPLLISVEPPTAGGLAFSNVVEVEIHTHLLPFAVDSPLRLYKAPKGGRFYDITTDIRPGSVRERGRTGGFSDFLILVDLTPSRDAAEAKYDFLDQRLLSVSHSSTRSQLQADLAASRTAFAGGNYAAANTAMAGFESRVRQSAGNTIPNGWRAQRDLDNIAGDLLSEAGSLRFNLGRLGG